MKASLRSTKQGSSGIAMNGTRIQPQKDNLGAPSKSGQVSSKAVQSGNGSHLQTVFASTTSSGTQNSPAIGLSGTILSESSPEHPKGSQRTVPAKTTPPRRTDSTAKPISVTRNAPPAFPAGTLHEGVRQPIKMGYSGTSLGQNALSIRARSAGTALSGSDRLTKPGPDEVGTSTKANSDKSRRLGKIQAK
jgi:hypothetical protein